MTSIRKKLAAHTLLLLALLMAQLAVQAHAFSHLQYSGDAASAPATQTQLCAECLAGTPLSAAAGAPNLTFAFFAAHPEKIDGIRFVSRVDRTPHHAFRSRAPPYLV